MRRNLLLAALLVLVFAGLASACPSCRDTIANTDAASAAGGAPGTAGISSAFNSGIYIMLGAFLGVLGLVAGVIVKGIRGR